MAPPLINQSTSQQHIFIKQLTKISQVFHILHMQYENADCINPNHKLENSKPTHVSSQVHQTILKKEM
jgi:hypothetical protein